jgi:hypothetical protein
LIVNNAAKRTWGKNIAIDAVNIVRVYRFGAKFFNGALYRFFVNVGDNKLCPFFMKMTALMISDIANPLHGDDFSF